MFLRCLNDVVSLYAVTAVATTCNKHGYRNKREKHETEYQTVRKPHPRPGYKYAQ